MAECFWCGRSDCVDPMYHKSLDDLRRIVLPAAERLIYDSGHEALKLGAPVKREWLPALVEMWPKTEE